MVGAMNFLRVIALLVVLLPTILLSGPASLRRAGGAAHAVREAARPEIGALQSATPASGGTIADPCTPPDAGQWLGRVSAPRTPVPDPVFRIAFAALPGCFPPRHVRALDGLRTEDAAARGNFCRRSVQRRI